MGQLLLVVGAITLLATLQLSINSSILGAVLSTYDNEATVEAISVGQAMVDEILTQAFDSLTVEQLVTNQALFTPTARLGKDIDSEKTVAAYEREPFQSQIKFNDIDDYNLYTRIVATPYLGDFTIKDSVYYVLESNQTSKSTPQTWYKKVVIRVTHPNLISPIVLKSLVVYRKYIQPS